MGKPNEIISTMYVLAVNDLKQSSDYYRDVLGFEIHPLGDDNDDDYKGWRIFQKDTCSIMAGHCPDAIPPFELGDHSYFAYITMNGIDSYFEQVRERGGRILKTVRDEPWGNREFALQTIDGHRIMFGQRLDSSL